MFSIIFLQCAGLIKSSLTNLVIFFFFSSGFSIILSIKILSLFICISVVNYWFSKLSI
ncbi:uncharacterized protein BX663DRAFT_517427 [Cokeromyces recurvatus]|uniref:uncharacterized protein n=1 Tax=Cokeromyces recurvatus TaxID=90255 RepID=UPI00221F4DD0|nr:uncharacterized protein BX663DRAFT_517427 [Cokeromyces recurvatus]KAI7900391.1 hypothetical protein BX663DRAFT_517427 [Cokeromyces recurvatus]